MVRISDIELLNILKENSRMQFVRIAEKLKVSETAVRKKIKRLESNGAITKYTIEINPNKLGFNINALIGIDTLPEFYIPVMEKLKQTDKISGLYSASGDHMLLLECLFKDSKELSDFVQGLQKINGITKVCPAILLEKIK